MEPDSPKSPFLESETEQKTIQKMSGEEAVSVESLPDLDFIVPNVYLVDKDNRLPEKSALNKQSLIEELKRKQLKISVSENNNLLVEVSDVEQHQKSMEIFKNYSVPYVGNPTITGTVNDNGDYVTIFTFFGTLNLKNKSIETYEITVDSNFGIDYGNVSFKCFGCTISGQQCRNKRRIFHQKNKKAWCHYHSKQSDEYERMVESSISVHKVKNTWWQKDIFADRMFQFTGLDHDTVFDEKRTSHMTEEQAVESYLLSKIPASGVEFTPPIS
jgi:hypothetical protein